MASTQTRRRVHYVLAIFFAAQVPLAIWAQFAEPEFFEKLWKTYLIFLSLYAIVVGHWSGASAETPMDDEIDGTGTNPSGEP